MNSAPPPGLEYRVKHTSHYAYAETVSLSMHLVRLTPRPSETQTVRETRLLIDPPASGSITRKDYFGNVTTTFTIQDAHRHLRVTAESLVSVSGTARAGLDSPSLAEALVRLRARETADERRTPWSVRSTRRWTSGGWTLRPDHAAPLLLPDRGLIDHV